MEVTYYDYYIELRTKISFLIETDKKWFDKILKPAIKQVTDFSPEGFQADMLASIKDITLNSIKNFTKKLAEVVGTKEVLLNYELEDKQEKHLNFALELFDHYDEITCWDILRDLKEVAGNKMIGLLVFLTFDYFIDNNKKYLKEKRLEYSEDYFELFEF